MPELLPHVKKKFSSQVFCQIFYFYSLVQASFFTLIKQVLFLFSFVLLQQSISSRSANVIQLVKLHALSFAASPIRMGRVLSFVSKYFRLQLYCSFYIFL